MGVKLGLEQHGLRVFENRVLRTIFRPNRGWRKLHNEELNSLYSIPSIIRMIMSRGMRWARDAARNGAKMSAYRILVRKPERKRPLGRRRR
jgi:acyl-coenzyme A synthetase/AMP-(fatty) acid ligase